MTPTTSQYCFNRTIESCAYGRMSYITAALTIHPAVCNCLLVLYQLFLQLSCNLKQKKIINSFKLHKNSVNFILFTYHTNLYLLTLNITDIFDTVISVYKNNNHLSNEFTKLYDLSKNKINANSACKWLTIHLETMQIF